MSRRPARFKQSDLTRAIKAIARAGARMTVEVLPDGTIRISPSVDKPAGRVADQREVYL
jgi:hypothetical protein